LAIGLFHVTGYLIKKRPVPTKRAAVDYILYLVPSIHNKYKDQMVYYNWVILGDMFRPLNGHLQANIELELKLKTL